VVKVKVQEWEALGKDLKEVLTVVDEEIAQMEPS